MSDFDHILLKLHREKSLRLSFLYRFSDFLFMIYLLIQYPMYDLDESKHLIKARSDEICFTPAVTHTVGCILITPKTLVNLSLKYTKVTVLLNWLLKKITIIFNELACDFTAFYSVTDHLAGFQLR